MGIVIAVTSGKGGTGKTSLTSGIASCLAIMGQQVLCIDMDIGLRNLDITLGMTDRALMDVTDVLDGRCTLARGAAIHPKFANLSLLTAPLTLPPGGIDRQAFGDLLWFARQEYDYILIDAPAGLGLGFQLATFAADRAIVVATTDPTALRDAQRTVSDLSGRVPSIHLIVNRVQPKLLRRMHTNIDDAMDAAGLPLLGVVPEDTHVSMAAMSGQPLITATRRGAALASLNIAKRLTGQRIPLMKIR